MHLLSLLLGAVGGVVRYITSLLRSAHAYFRFRHYFGDSILNLLGEEPVTSSSTKCRSFFESCYSGLRSFFWSCYSGLNRFAQATRSFFRSLFGPCSLQCFRSRHNHEEDDLDTVSVMSYDGVSLFDCSFARLHEAFSPARAGCSIEIRDLNHDGQGEDDQGKSCCPREADQDVEREAHGGSRIITSALVHNVRDTCSDRGISV